MTVPAASAIIPCLRYRDARAAIADQDYGGRGCACRDPEGDLWWFGTPWQPGHPTA